MTHRNKPRQSFEEQFAKYEAELYRIAYVYVKNPQDALDVMQETAYKAYKNRSSLKEAKYMKTWLSRITINCAIDHIRRNKPILPLEDWSEPLSPITHEEEQQIILRTTLSALMNTLDPTEKSIVILKYYEQCTFHEIAESLHLPLGTVKTTLYRALHKLRAAAKEEDLL